MIGAVEIGAELLVLAVAIVHPDLDEVHLPRGQFLHCLPGFGFVRDPVRGFGAPRLRHRDSAARRAKQRPPGNDFVSHLECDIACVLAQAGHGADAVERLLLQPLDERLAGRRHVRMRVDDRRHHRLAGQVHACRARRHLHLAAPANLHKATIVDDEYRILNRRGSIADDDARPLEHGDGWSRRAPEQLLSPSRPHPAAIQRWQPFGA